MTSFSSKFFIKLECHGHIRRISFLSTSNFQEVRTRIEQVLNLKESILTFIDNEGDTILLDSDIELSILKFEAEEKNRLPRIIVSLPKQKEDDVETKPAEKKKWRTNGPRGCRAGKQKQLQKHHDFFFD